MMKKVTFLLLACLISLFTQAQTWTKLALPETGKTIKDIYVDSNNNFFALTNQGLFKSSDNAENWTLLDRNMEGNSILLATNNNDVWVSGVATIKYNGTSSDQQDNSVVGNPTVMQQLSDGKIISIVSVGTSIYNTKNRMRTSTDNGVTFDENSSITNIFYKPRIKAELMVKKNDDIFYLGADKNLYKSTDKGTTFTAMGGVITYTNKENGLYLDKEKGAFYALWGSNNAKDLKKSTDDGATWTKLNSSKLYGADRIVANNDIVIIHGSWFFSYSSDGGTTFTNKSSMFESGNFPEKVIITADGRVFGTNIKGNAIVELDMVNETQTLKTKGLDFTNPKGLSYNGTRLAVCLDGYAHYTDDNGTTWQQLKGDGAFAGNTFVSKSGKVYTASTKSGTWNGVYVQNTTNDSMEEVTADVNSLWNMRSMFEDGKGAIYCLSNLYGLYKSTDGKNFTQMANAPYDNLNDMRMWFDEGLKRIYAIVSGEIHYSDDYAVTWVKGTPLNGVINHFFKGNGGIWSHSFSQTPTETGFYFSSDLSTWSGPYQPNISFDDRWDFPVHGNLGVLYRAHKDNAYTGGTVIESTDNGVTWNSYDDGLEKVKGYGFNGGNKGVPFNEILASNDKLFLATVGSIYMANQNNSLSVKNNSSDFRIKMYPNPTSDILNISSNNQKIKEVEVFNLLGKSVINYKNNDIKKLNIQTLPTGMYVLKIKTDTNTFSKKIFKN